MSFDYHFIHNYKSLGQTILHQLSDTYRRRYYGESTIKALESRNPGMKINRDVLKKSKLTYEKKTPIDHIHIDLLIDLNILPKHRMNSLKYMMIVREPLERFISICNFQPTPPDELIRQLKTNKHDIYYQYKFAQSKYKLKIKTIKMTNKKGIVRWFSQFNQPIDLTKHDNVSVKKYSMADLSDEDIAFLTTYYKKDYELFRNAA